MGQTYGHETQLLGTFPDVLVVVGGGPNAGKEYQMALSLGTRVLMLVLKEYPPGSIAYG